MLLTMIASTVVAAQGQTVASGSHLVALRHLPPFVENPQDAAWESPAIGWAGQEWNEMIVSWNVENGAGSRLGIEARAVYPDRPTKWFSLGTWSPDGLRESVNGQKDEDGDVLTDTLRLSAPFERFQIRLTPVKAPGTEPRLKLVTICLSRPLAALPLVAPYRRAWGSVVEAPQRSQMSYPNGNVLCSPTCVSMVLAHFSRVLGRADLDRDVPEVQAGVHDPAWGGTGNWPFNTAFAGSLPGMLGYVSRFDGIHELERWTASGLPVVTSVAYDLLKGKPKSSGKDGHLVVLVGFTKEGDPVFNDPGRSKEIRQVYRRDHFDAAWARSGRTVYLIHPEGARIPANAYGHWLAAP